MHTTFHIEILGEGSEGCLTQSLAAYQSNIHTTVSQVSPNSKNKAKTTRCEHQGATTVYHGPTLEEVLVSLFIYFLESFSGKNMWDKKL